MGRMGSFKCKGLEELRRELEKLQKTQEAFIESCAKELAGRLLRMVVKRTPLGKYGKSYVTDADGNHVRYKSGRNKGKVKRVTVKKGGTLRRSWTLGEIRKEGSVYKIDIINPVEYAPYVEHGHRTANHKGWVQGHFMMTISEQELKKIAPKVLENKIKEYLKGLQK